MNKDHKNGIYNRIDALRKKTRKINVYIENDNKKLMSEIFPPPWKRKRINLNMDSKNNSMHLCITNIELFRKISSYY